MSETRPTYDDEIDLFELFETLWNGKWLISAFVFAAILCGSGFLLIKDSVYESKLFYSIDTLPPFYKTDKALSDFRKMFYSNRVFDDWKKSSDNSIIVFEDFVATEFVDGFVLAKDKDERLVILESEKKGTTFVLVKTNQLPLLNDFYSYANHINDILKAEYVFRVKEELTIIETRFKDVALSNNVIVQNVLSMDRYIFDANKGAKVLTIQRPSAPKKVSPKSSLIITLSVVLGGMIGIFFILVRNAIRKRKEQSAKA